MRGQGGEENWLSSKLYPFPSIRAQKSLFGGEAGGGGGLTEGKLNVFVSFVTFSIAVSAM